MVIKKTNNPLVNFDGRFAVYTAMTGGYDSLKEPVTVPKNANFWAIGDISQFLNCLSKTLPFASNSHPTRNCIYDEGTSCCIIGKDNIKLMRHQLDTYRREGMPEHFGLYETNLIACEHNNPLCIAVMEDWWNEINRFSRRDQLSLPYVLWKQGYHMDELGFTCDTNIRLNPVFRVYMHSEDWT